MRLNTAGTSINTSLYVSGLTIFNNASTHISTLNVSGVTTLSNNTIINGDSQFQPKLLLSGREFYSGGGNFTSTDGIALLMGVNRTGNRQLWLGDSSNLTVNTTNPILRISNSSIDCMATDGVTRLPFYLGGGALMFNANARPVLNKVLQVNATPSDTRASIKIGPSAQRLRSSTGLCFISSPFHISPGNRIRGPSGPHHAGTKVRHATNGCSHVIR